MNEINVKNQIECLITFKKKQASAINICYNTKEKLTDDTVILPHL